MTTNENENMKELADYLWAYFKPKIEEMIKPYMKMMRAKVAVAAANNVIGVKIPFYYDENGNDKVIYLPYASSIAEATVGSSVWVAMPYSGMMNAVIIGDGKLSNL